MARNYLLGLQEIGFPVRAVNLYADHTPLLDPEGGARIKALMRASAGWRPIEVVHFAPEVYPQVRTTYAAARIGCTIFETDRIPDHWARPCNQMDEVWVPSEFNRETFARSGVQRDKIRVIPYSVDTDFFKAIPEKFDLEGLKTFRFLYVAFWDWRKGFDLLLEAYFREFTIHDDVSLIIKTSCPTQGGECASGEDIRAVMMSCIQGKVDLSRTDLPHLCVVTRVLSQEELRRLYNTCDLYISTDRANGWGMPCMEAMAMGKPASTIDWSGSTEFMKEGNSLLIRPMGRLVPVDERLAAARPLYRGHQWAEVSVDEVRRVMRFAFEDRAKLQEIASKGMEYVRENHSLKAVAYKLRECALRVELKRRGIQGKWLWSWTKRKLLPEDSRRRMIYDRLLVPLKGHAAKLLQRASVREALR